MRTDRLMNKSVKQAEKETGTSPYIKRCGEYTVEVEFAGSCSLESCLAAYLNEKYRIGVLKRKQHSDSEHQAIPAGNTLQCSRDRG